jgi:glycosyltransferase involved in cell wall biosynthesis
MIIEATTVLFTSHNGSSTLPAMLEAFTRLEPPPGGLKIIAVENASTDNTGEVLSRYQSRLPLTILSQPARGKNKALNIAIPALAGDLVVFTDDDVIPESNWVIRLRRAAAEHPEYDIFGGRITPHWIEEPPSWLFDLLPTDMAYALTDEHLETGPISASRVWGPNMALRARVFADGSRFNEAIGPGSGQYIMGSETEFTRRLQNCGYRALHVREAVVKHIIRPHQVDPKWVVQRTYRYGRGKAALHLATGKRKWTANRRLRQMVGCWLQAHFFRVCGRRDKWFLCACAAKFHQGYLVQQIHHKMQSRRQAAPL